MCRKIYILFYTKPLHIIISNILIASYFLWRRDYHSPERMMSQFSHISHYHFKMWFSDQLLVFASSLKLWVLSIFHSLSCKQFKRKLLQLHNLVLMTLKNKVYYVSSKSSSLLLLTPFSRFIHLSFRRLIQYYYLIMQGQS